MSLSAEAPLPGQIERGSDWLYVLRQTTTKEVTSFKKDRQIVVKTIEIICSIPLLRLLKLNRLLSYYFTI